MTDQKRYAAVGPYMLEVPSACNICGKDVSADPAKFHYGHCPRCGMETRHIIPFHGVPWHCRESHADDATACATCGKTLDTSVVVSGLLTRGGGIKRLCPDCDPLAQAQKNLQS